jgi:type III restriction enzyme
MIGRVLRQPEAKLTGTPSLNECYVFTFDQEVQAAVDSVRRGLEEEGMGDLSGQCPSQSAKVQPPFPAVNQSGAGRNLNG